MNTPFWYCIRGIPTGPKGEKALKELKCKGSHHHKIRGRGARSKDHYQDLPVERAAKVSLYGYPIGSHRYIRQHLDFKGRRDDGKLVLRVRSVDSPWAFLNALEAGQ